MSLFVLSVLLLILLLLVLGLVLDIPAELVLDPHHLLHYLLVFLVELGGGEVLVAETLPDLIVFVDIALQGPFHWLLNINHLEGLIPHPLQRHHQLPPTHHEIPQPLHELIVVILLHLPDLFPLMLLLGLHLLAALQEFERDSCQLVGLDVLLDPTAELHDLVLCLLDLSLFGSGEFEGLVGFAVDVVFEVVAVSLLHVDT